MGWGEPHGPTPEPAPVQRPEARWVPMYDGAGNECGMRAEHDGPCVFVDGFCSCGKLGLGLGLDEAAQI